MYYKALRTALFQYSLQALCLLFKLLKLSLRHFAALQKFLYDSLWVPALQLLLELGKLS
jgi:hypothetical protein